MPVTPTSSALSSSGRPWPSAPHPTMYQAHPKILAVDPARFGDDFSVITLRQGLKVYPKVALSGFDGVDLASRIFEIVRKEGPISCIAYDAIGNGADLDSALRRMQGLPALIPVTWGVPAKGRSSISTSAAAEQNASSWRTARSRRRRPGRAADQPGSTVMTRADSAAKSKKDLRKMG